MEDLAVASAGVVLLDRCHSTIMMIQNKYKSTRKVSEKCSVLMSEVVYLMGHLHQLTERDDPHLSPTQNAELKEIVEFSSQADKELREIRDSFRGLSKLRLFLRAWRVAETLEVLIDRINKLSQIATPSQADGVIQASSSTKEDVFSPRYNVPPTPANLVLKLDNKETYEGKVRESVLGCGTKVVEAVAVHGMGGVGKTCTITAVGNDLKVQNHFTGGVYFMFFGPNATDGDVVNKIASKVEESGGKTLSNHIRNDNDFERAIEKGRAWFSGHKCLFICDDMWRCKSRRNGYLSSMRRLCNDKDGGCVLVSTRDRQMFYELDEQNIVNLKERDEKVAKEIICRYAGMKKGWVECLSQNVSEALKKTLEKCDGLPVALAVAGRGIQSTARRIDVDIEEEIKRIMRAIVMYSEKLERSFHARVALGKKGYGEHDGLFASLETSLKSGTEIFKDGEGDRDLCLESLHRGLCVLQKQAWAPVTMLSCLWDIEEEAVEHVVEVMEELSVCRIEVREVNGKEMLGIQIHDLIHDHCVLQAGKHEEVKWWHEKVVEGYRRRYKTSGEENNGDVGWWSKEVVYDLYIHTNLARHLVESGKVDELEMLMLDYRWTMRQLTVNPYFRLDSDFRQLMSRAQQREEREGSHAKGLAQNVLHPQITESGIVDEIELIVNTLRISWPRTKASVKEHDFRQLSFQLVGRLANATKHMARVKRYLNSVRETPSKPHILPVENCMGSMGQSVKEVYVGSEVSSVALLPDPNRVIVGVWSGEVLLVDARSPEIVKRYKGHQSSVMSVAVSRDGRQMVSGSWDETLRIWDVEEGIVIGNPLIGHEGPVWSVAMNENHDLIASGSSRGAVRLWRLSTGAPIGEPLRGHGGDVPSVALSSDGRRVVSCSQDKTIRVWSVSREKEILGPLCDHDASVRSVAISRNDRWIVSGSCDETVRLWDSSSGSQIRGPLRGHEDFVNSVAISDDSQVIASASSDNTVRVWSASEGVGKLTLRGHTSFVSCVELSHDGSRVVSGSYDQTVRIWNISRAEDNASTVEKKEVRKESAVCVSIDRKIVASGYDDGGICILDLETGRAKETGLHGDDSEVWSIAMSRDKQYIVSGSADCTVRIWSAATGKQIGDALHGHEGPVNSIAISHSCQWFVSASNDRTMRLWRLQNGNAIGEPLEGHAHAVNWVTVSDDDQFVASGSRDCTVRIWNVRTGKPIGNLLRHDYWVMSLYISRDNQQVISRDWRHKVYLWNVSMGTDELLDSVAEGPDRARLLWKARNGWSSEEQVGAASGNEKPRVVIAGQEVYICDPTRNPNLFEKVGQFDTWVKYWVIDATGEILVCFWGRKLARLRMVAGSSDALGTREVVNAF